MKWSAGWGSACDPCAKAKTRCIRSPENSDTKCNRCLSLKIDCPQQVRKPRKKRRRQSASVPTSHEIPDLELRNGAINTTSDTGHSQSTLLTSQGTRSATYRGSLSQISTSEHNEYVAHVKIEPSGAFKASTWLPGFHPFPTPTCTCPADLAEDEGSEPKESDDTLLSIYRTRLTPQFPFVVIPDGVTAAELQSSRPFLARAIRMVASLRDRRSMWSQSKGIIVFLGFYHYFCFAHGHFNNLAHLASSMVADMRLDRPRTRPQLRKKGPQGIEPDEPKDMTNDERRAILAVWYLNSSFAVSFKTVNSPNRHFTHHMERQFEDLQEGRACETDEVLLQLVCSQRINEMIAQLQQSEQSVDVRPSSNVWVANVDRLLADLETLRGPGNQRKAQHYTVSSHYNVGMMQLLEPQLVELGHLRNHEAVAALRNTPDYFHFASKGGQDAADIALRACFETWLNIPVCHLFYMPMSAFLQFTSGIVILLRRARLILLNRYRLGDSHYPDTAIDHNIVPTGNNTGGNADDLMLDLLSRLASRFEEARIEMAAAHCSAWSNDFLDLLSWKLRERKGCIEKWVNIIAKEAQSNTIGGAEGVGMQQHHRPSDMMFGNEGIANGFPNMEEPALWLDPLEALLLGGEEPHDSWF